MKMARDLVTTAQVAMCAMGPIAGDGSEGERRVRSICAKALATNLGDAAKLAKRVRLARFDEASGGQRRRPRIMRILYVL